MKQTISCKIQTDVSFNNTNIILTLEYKQLNVAKSTSSQHMNSRHKFTTHFSSHVVYLTVRIHGYHTN